MRYARRLENYRVFRRNLSVPLVTVEWSRSGDPGPQLGPGDADLLIQVQSPDLLWQKEQLLNIALQALPDDCRCVAWLDCDIVFNDPTWPELTVERLNDFAVLQLFETAYDVERDTTIDVGGGGSDRPHGRRILSIVHANVIGATTECHRSGEVRPQGFTTGLGWAAGTDLLRRHGFCDACVGGGGNRALHGAMYGWFDHIAEYIHMGPSWRDHYLAWSSPFFADVRQLVGCVPGRVYHLWHGDLGRRKYAERHAGLAPFRFDPASDVLIDDSGCWRWASEKPRMHDHIAAYFASRQEDG